MDAPLFSNKLKLEWKYKARNNTLARRRRSREGRRNTGVAEESRLTRGPVDQYGQLIDEFQCMTVTLI
ncbi:hypothetical protein KUCAC02_015128 [Chaenocephalus aceratus]|uniref:Uncharacterized protein n=1 Tax=Chaenocephalus aceratus TaxID=36190 RepID=A0ACB9XXS0_CHAAC|nr:hypothetical protein KUCAC02_015128 [Chaenocephalus aceratus]